MTKKGNAFPLRWRIRQACLLSSFLSTDVLEALVSAVRKRNNRNTDGKERYKTVPICKQHNFLCRTFQEIYKNV